MGAEGDWFEADELPPEAKFCQAVLHGSEADVEAAIKAQPRAIRRNWRLQAAAAAGDAAQVKDALGAWLFRPDPFADDGRALKWAAQNGHAPVVGLLLAHGAAHHKKIIQEALCMAAADGHAQVVGMLIPGCDPAAEGSLALEVAVRSGDMDTVNLLLPVSRPKDRHSIALCTAAEIGHAPMVRTLLPLSDASAAGGGGVTDLNALETAAMLGNLDVVWALLPAIDARHDNSNALALALRRGHESVVRTLLPVSEPNVLWDAWLKPAYACRQTLWEILDAPTWDLVGRLLVPYVTPDRVRAMCEAPSEGIPPQTLANLQAFLLERVLDAPTEPERPLRKLRL